MDKQTAPNTFEHPEEEIDLLELLYYFIDKIVYIMGSFIAGALIAGLITFFLITPKYSATSKVYMVSASSGTAVDLTDLNIGTSLSADYEVLMKIRPIYEDVIQEMELDYTVEELQKMVTISSISGTRILTVTTESTSPEEARDITNAISKKAVDYLPELMETPTPHIAERALLPKHKSSPSLVKNTLIGALLLTVLCLAVLTVLFLQDDTLKTAEDVEKEFGIMPLTVIPLGAIKGFGGEDGKKRRKRREKPAKGV